MKPIKNTHREPQPGDLIRRLTWPCTGSTTDYYTIKEVTWNAGTPRIHLRDFDASYTLNDMTKWEIL
jgi:hypothetical protein